MLRPQYSSLPIEDICELTECGFPHPLEVWEARGFPSSWIYIRSVGLFFVPYGRHNATSRILLEWRGYDTKLTAGPEMCEVLLEQFPGSCYRSSVSSKIITRRGNLNEVEMSYFIEHDFIYLN